MIWFFIFLGVCLTLGGFCLCCGCSYCNDGTTTATLQLDVSGIAVDEDNGSGCCAALNQSYILDMDPDDSCHFLKTYEDGDCETDACNTCDSTGCTVACTESPTKICEPGFPLRDCSRIATVTYDTNCQDCEDTEGATINFLESGAPEGCTCDCLVSTDVWDTDVMIADHPEATWAVVGEFVYYCDCVPEDCTAVVGKSGAFIEAWIGNDLPPGVTIRTAGAVTGGEFATLTSITTDSDTACASSISSLDLSASLSTTPCSETHCLCTLPTSIIATYLP